MGVGVVGEGRGGACQESGEGRGPPVRRRARTRHSGAASAPCGVGEPGGFQSLLEDRARVAVHVHEEEVTRKTYQQEIT